MIFTPSPIPVVCYFVYLILHLFISFFCYILSTFPRNAFLSTVPLKQNNPLLTKLGIAQVKIKRNLIQKVIDQIHQLQNLPTHSLQLPQRKKLSQKTPVVRRSRAPSYISSSGTTMQKFYFRPIFFSFYLSSLSLLDRRTFSETVPRSKTKKK